jgi:predicted phage terminase large subunit-like protein
VKPFLDEEDYPRKELSGKTRYFVVVEGVLYTSWDEQELRDAWDKEPETYTYIPATLDDNEALDTLDKSYRKKLDSMPEGKRKQLLLGCWSSTEDTCIFYKREDVKRASQVPLNCMVVRGYDLASTADDTPATVGCDATASVLVAKSKDGYYYLLNGEYYRKRTGDRDATIVAQGKRDGSDVHIVIPKDSGAGGSAAFEYLSKYIMSEGLIPKKDVSSSTASKLKKAEPFFTAVQNGLVFIVESGWDRKTLEYFHRECENFDGVTKSSRTRHDDFVDAVSSAINHLNTVKVYTVPKLGAFAAPPPSVKAIALADI